jgi:AmmeMemoRadiSam system protein B
MADNLRPKIRRLQISPAQLSGQQVLVLRDPLGVSDRTFAVPKVIVPLLELCDGTRDVGALRAALELRAGLRVGPEYLEKMITDLDEALLLDNERFAEAYRETVKRFRAAPARTPTLAGTVYPDDAEGLEGTIDSYFEKVSKKGPTSGIRKVRGLVSPHIDYQRGADVYAQVWRGAEKAVRSAEVVVLLGTNHFDCQRMITLTRQNYSTPWGVLPTAANVVDRLAADLGEGVFAEELHHRVEHSVEIAAVWLHYLIRNRECELVPVLCGSFQRFIDGNGLPGGDEEIALFVSAVREATAGRRTLIVAAGDLAHMGPAFGDSFAMDAIQTADLSAADGELMSTIASGDAEAVFDVVKRDGDRRRICGLAPIYLALRLLGETTGKVTGYAQCPADQHDTSCVSICGVLLG